MQKTNKWVCFFSAFLLCFFSSCSFKEKSTDFNFQTVYNEGFGLSEEEFLQRFEIDENHWTVEAGTTRDFSGKTYDSVRYYAAGIGNLEGVPCEIQIEFTDGFGLTGISYWGTAENISSEEYYNQMMTIYRKTRETFGEPGDPRYVQEGAVLNWEELGDAETYFANLTPVTGTAYASEWTIWGDISEDFPTTSVTLTTRCSYPFNDANAGYFEIKISRDITHQNPQT